MHQVLCGLAANPALPAALLDRLVATADDDIAAHLVDRVDLTPVQAVAIATRTGRGTARLVLRGLLPVDAVDPVSQPVVALDLLAAGAGRPEWARLLAGDPVAERRQALASCRGLPPDVTDRLADDPDVDVVMELAAWAPADVAARLAAHPCADVRSAVAGNEATPPAVLAALAGDEGLPPARWCLACTAEDRPGRRLSPGAACSGRHESAVHDTQMRTVRNPATPAAAVAGFAGHPSLLLRWQLAARPDLPAATYERLAASPEPGVRATLAANPAIGGALIRASADDPGYGVRRGLAHHPHVPLDILIRLAGAARIGATLLPRVAAATPAEVERLAASPDPAVRMLAAERRDLLPGVRDALAADPDAKVLASIAPHPGLSEAQLRTMLDRHGARVAVGVARNPDAPPALLVELARHRPPVRKALRAIARHRHATGPALLPCLADGRARPIAAGHPALPPATVVELVADDDWQVVEAAAANPSLPAAVMDELISRRRTD